MTGVSEDLVKGRKASLKVQARVDGAFEVSQ